MEKEYLGLGIVFNALDKGFSKSIDVLKASLSGAGDAMAKIAMKAGDYRKNFLSGVTEGFKMLSLSKIGSTLGDIRDGIDGAGHGVDDTAKSLDFMRAKMTAALDPKVAGRFTASMMPLIKSGELTGDQADIVAHNFANSGVQIDKIAKTLPLVGTLVGKLGMDAGQVSSMFGQAMGNLQLSGDQMGQLTKSVFKLQRDYQLTDLMTPLPEIVSNVYSNMIKLQKSSPHMAMQMVQDVTRMTAAFQKMGFSQNQAVHASTTFNDKLNDLRGAFKDVEAGLDPESDIIQSLYDAFGAGGLNAAGLVKAVTSGKKTNEEIMKQMQDMIAAVPEEQRDNITRRLRRVFGDELTAIMGPMQGQMKAVNDEAAAQSKKVGTADKVFEAFNGQLSNTLQFMERSKAAAVGFTKTLATLIDKDRMVKALATQRDAWNALASQIADTTSVAGEAFRILNGYKSVGASFLLPNSKELATASVWTSTLSDMIFSLTSLVGVFTILKTPMKFVWDLFKVGGGFLKPIVGLLRGGLATAMEGLTTSFLEIAAAGEAAGGIFGTIASAAVALATGPIGLIIAGVVAIGVAVATVVHYWDDLIDMVGRFSKPAASAMRKFGIFVGDVWDGIKSGADYLVGSVGNYFKFLGKVAVLAFDVIAHGGEAMISGLISLWGKVSPAIGAVWDTVKQDAAAALSFLSGIWDSVTTAVSTKVASVLKSLGTIFVALKPVLDPIMNFFSDVKKTASNELGGIWDYFLAKFESVKGAIMNGVRGLTDMLPDFLKHDVKDAFSAFKSIFVHGEDQPQPGQVATAPTPTTPMNPLQAVTGAVSSFFSPSMGPAAASAPVATAAPTKVQAGAPSQSMFTGIDLTPTAVPKLDDKNFQAMVQMLADTKDAIVKAMAGVGNRPVEVKLVGDARKFFQASSAAAANDAGRAGLNAALGG